MYYKKIESPMQMNMNLIQHLQVIDKYTLNLIDNLNDTSLWSQGWRKAVDLGLGGNLAERWDHFLA
jgi:hypothetical protein